MKQKFYICSHCGNIISMIRDKGVPVYCCSEEMQEIIPETTEASKEKHKCLHSCNQTKIDKPLSKLVDFLYKGYEKDIILGLH